MRDAKIKMLTLSKIVFYPRIYTQPLSLSQFYKHPVYASSSFFVKPYDVRVIDAGEYASEWYEKITANGGLAIAVVSAKKGSIDYDFYTPLNKSGKGNMAEPIKLVGGLKFTFTSWVSHGHS